MNNFNNYTKQFSAQLCYQQSPLNYPSPEDKHTRTPNPMDHKILPYILKLEASYSV